MTTIGSTAGRYRVLGRIAAGGMGEVYRATIETAGGIEKTIALKLVRADLASEQDFAAMFVEEAKVAMSLSHANVVQAFDVGRIDDRWFLAMEHVEGTTLAAILRACREELRQPMPHRHVLLVIVDVLKGLDYAHRRRGPGGEPLDIVHRDVSPANVLVSFEGEVKIADFGIAKSALRTVGSMAGSIKGKLPYMAPEQLRGGAVDRRSDLYSTGAMLYEMLVGRRAYDAEQPSAIEDVIAGRHPRPRELVPAVSEELERIVLRAMAVDPAERYPSAAAMRQELEALSMKEGYLLSTSDLAEFVELVVGRTAAPPDVSERPGVSTTPGGSVMAAPATPLAEAAAGADPFDAILGMELEKIDSAEPFSVFATRRGIAVEEVKRAAAAAAVAVPAAPGPEPVAGAVQRRQPGLPVEGHEASQLAFLWGVLLMLVVCGGAVLLGLRARPEHRDDTPLTQLQGPTRTETPPRTQTPAPTPPRTVPEEEGRAPATRPEREEGQSPPEAEQPATRLGTPQQVPTPTRTPARVRTPAPSPAIEPGLVSINTDPWAYVSIDGAQIRATPLLRHSLAAGRHRIVLRNPAESLERSLSIEIAPGEHRRISLDLRAAP